MRLGILMRYMRYKTRLLTYLEFANGTFSVMVDEFAYEFWKVSEESLGRDETPRH